MQVYPALILPGGPSRLKCVNNTFYLDYRIAQGKGRDGRWHILYPSDVIDPIPSGYYPELIDHHFGFIGNAGEVDGLQKRGAFYRVLARVGILHKRKISEAAMNNLKGWLRNNLLRGGFNADTIKITEARMFIRLPAGAVIKNEVTNEIALPLGQ